jgi:hypothetical protein
MKDKFSNPLEAVAGVELQRQFGDLLSVRAKMSDLEYGLVASMLANIFALQLSREDRKRWEQTVRAAHYYLDQGALKRTREICQSYARINDHISGAFNDVFHKRDAIDKLMGDEWIEALLSLYKTTTEGLLTIIAAPVIVGFRHVYGIKNPAFNPKPDGRIDIKAIELMEDWSAAPSNLLKEGLNRHVRNAYAHHRYRILDDDIVEMWDETPQGKLTWGRERFAFSEVQDLCDRLILTCIAITLALAIFGTNYQQLMIDRGWVPPDRVTPPLRFEELRQLVAHYAEYNSFKVESVQKENEELVLKLKTRPRGIDQTEKILLGGVGGARGYDRDVRYEQKLVAEMVLGVLQRTVKPSDGYRTYRLEVRDEDNNALGELAICSSALMKVGGPNQNDLPRDRALAARDTLGDSMMWVRIEAAPRPR